MAMYKKVSASIAALAVVNVLAGDKVSTAPYPRTLRAIAVTVRDNTPALGDITWILTAGPMEIARGRGILENSSGPEITYPDGFDPVGMVIGPNTVLSLEITDADSGAAHSVMFALDFDRL
ncbi:MAG: hypothetical protein ABR585_14230 [Gemmatimonadaceae bacterium]